jgi:hypothetical protein
MQEYNQFIGTYPNVYPSGYCQHLIKEFERLAEAGAGANRKQSENAVAHNKNDYQIGVNVAAHTLLPFEEKDPADVFFQGLQFCFDLYTDKYSILKNDRIHTSFMKMQRTDPGGGYHVWHSEQSNGKFAERVVVYMLYLNTLEPESAGETEFLYQQTRLTPTENTMVLWPAAYTHAHRGNTVFGNTSKYIVTGWFYYD